MSSQAMSGAIALGAIAFFCICSEFVSRGKRPVETWRPPSALVYVGGTVTAIICSNLVPSPDGAAVAVLFAALCVCVVSDLKFGLVFDAVSVPSALILCGLAYLHGAFFPALVGGLICGGIILSLYLITLGAGIGLGDLKLAICIGVALGATLGVLAIGASFVFGGIHAFVLLLARKVKRGDALRFAPYLAMGSTFALLFSWLTTR